MSAAICSDKPLSFGYIVEDFAPKDRYLYRKLRMSSPKATDIVRSEAPSFPQAVNFIRCQAGAHGEKMTPFMRGLSYFVRSLEYGSSDHAARLIWAVAAIEAILTTPNERGTGLLVSRLVAALGDTSGIIKGRFRSVYEFRSKYVHGSLDVPIIVASDHAMPNLKSPSFFLGEHEMVGSAHDIAVSLIRRMIMLGREKLEFKTQLD